MLERVAGTIERYRMFEPGQKVGVAVSGGADSVCLFHVLRELAPRWDLRLSLLHCNHHLRGRESDEDAAFVRNIAVDSGLPFALSDSDPRAAGGNLEEAAREVRLAFFESQIRSGQVDRVAVGHTRSDQAETVLFRLLRGAGTAGLAGIRPVTAMGIVRPLLRIDRQETEQFLCERAISWREDTSNATLEFARNRIRRRLLPQLATEWNPAISHALAQMADWALAEEAYWEAEIDRLAALHLEVRADGILINTDVIGRLPLAAARRLVRRAMALAKGGVRAIDFEHVNAVLALTASREGHGRLQVPGIDILRSFEWLRFAKLPSDFAPKRHYDIALTVPAIVPVPGTDYAISCQVIENMERSIRHDSVYNEGMVCVDWERLSGPLQFRNWRPGDQYRPFGSAGEQKIKTLFQEFRVPLWDRRYWPVLTCREAIVWSRRFGPAADFAASAGTAKLLLLNEIGIEPGQAGVYNNQKGR
ncbi:MAG: tRNA lysidine(34) synthetase TilS [Acidobacteriia bacterium]|nr:tRNA lysidine(34) synthetase TilS [Terriglobia bacterium]